MSFEINKTKFDSATMTEASYSPNSIPIYRDGCANIGYFEKGNPICSITISVQGDSDCEKMIKLIREYSFTSTQIISKIDQENYKLWQEKEIN